MSDEAKAIRDSLFEIFSAGFQAGKSSDNLEAAFEEWFAIEMLRYMSPTSPYVS